MFCLRAQGFDLDQMTEQEREKFAKRIEELLNETFPDYKPSDDPPTREDVMLMITAALLAYGLIPMEKNG